MRPQHDPKGRDTLNRARRTDESEVYDDHGRVSLVRAPADRIRSVKGETLGTKRRRALTQRALALFAAGETIQDIAGIMDVAVGTVTGWITRHKREIAIGDIDEMLDKTAVPLAVDNLLHGLQAGDKDYTLEVLKGRGHFRRHVQGEEKTTVTLPPLVIRFEDAPHAEQQATNTIGHVIGVPMRSVGGQIVAHKQLGDGKPEEPIGVGAVRVPAPAEVSK